MEQYFESSDEKCSRKKIIKYASIFALSWFMVIPSYLINAENITLLIFAGKVIRAIFAMLLFGCIASYIEKLVIGFLNIIGSLLNENGKEFIGSIGHIAYGICVFITGLMIGGRIFN
jgi:hypothetical protein